MPRGIIKCGSDDFGMQFELFCSLSQVFFLFLSEAFVEQFLLGKNLGENVGQSQFLFAINKSSSNCMSIKLFYATHEISFNPLLQMKVTSPSFTDVYKQLNICW